MVTRLQGRGYAWWGARRGRLRARRWRPGMVHGCVTAEGRAGLLRLPSLAAAAVSYVDLLEYVRVRHDVVAELGRHALELRAAERRGERLGRRPDRDVHQKLTVRRSNRKSTRLNS